MVTDGNSEHTFMKLSKNLKKYNRKPNIKIKIRKILYYTVFKYRNFYNAKSKMFRNQSLCVRQ